LASLSTIKHKLTNDGYVIINDFYGQSDEDKHNKLLSFCEQFGTPIPHNSQPDSIIWHIKANDESYSYKTFSSHSAEAELHTDSAFSNNPEDMFVLYVLKSARCGGGISTLLHIDTILAHIHALPNGQEIEQTLKEPVFPFAVPSVFKRLPDEQFEYCFGAILYDQNIRFRSDSIRQCLKFNPKFLNAKQYQAFNAVNEIISDPNNYQHLHLNDNDLIIIDNKRILHGRTAFTDKERHVLRVRLSKN